MNVVKIDPIQALFWSAIVNGIVAVPVMATTVLLASDRKVMGQFVIPLGLRVAGWAATIVIALVSVGLFASL